MFPMFPLMRIRVTQTKIWDSDLSAWESSRTSCRAGLKSNVVCGIRVRAAIFSTYFFVTSFGWPWLSWLNAFESFSLASVILSIAVWPVSECLKPHEWDKCFPFWISKTKHIMTTNAAGDLTRYHKVYVIFVRVNSYKVFVSWKLFDLMSKNGYLDRSGPLLP